MELLTSTLTDRKPGLSGGSLVGLAAVIALLYFGRVFFITITVAIILAFILDPVVDFFMRLRAPRGLASFLTCSFALLIVYFGALVFYTQTAGLLADLPAYSQRINELVDSVVSRLENTEKSLSEIMTPKRQRDARAAQQPPPPPPPTKASKRRSAEPPLMLPPPAPLARAPAGRTSSTSPVCRRIRRACPTFDRSARRGT